MYPFASIEERMKAMYTDSHKKIWYKGNLHTHSNLSDGTLPYGEVAARYRKAGYDFLAVTDHWVPSKTEESPDFLLLSGCEYHIFPAMEYHGVKRGGTAFDVNGVGFTEPPDLKFEPGLTQQDIVDAIHQKDGIVVFNHPVWCRNTPEDIWAAAGYDGIEIYNSTCDYMNLGYQGVVVDQMAYGGLLLPVFAADDTHDWGRGVEFSGFIMVQAESLSRADILRAIRERKFFASRGPWVQARLEGNTVYVECTPVSSIGVLTNLPCGTYSLGNGLTSAKFDLPEGTYYYRVEVADENGKLAWTSPAACKRS
jgi:hypothetical protein